MKVQDHEKTRAFFARYDENIDIYFSSISEKQLKDEALWDLLVRQFSEKYDRLDDGWRGEFWGKLMRGASLIYAYNRDDELYGILENTVIALLQKLDKFGRITTYPKSAEFRGWDMWTRKYVMLGLEYFYEICPKSSLKRKIVAALKKQADYIASHVGTGKNQICINDTSHAWGAVNSVSIIQPFVKLFQLSGEKKYLDYAAMLIRTQGVNGTNLFEIAYRNELAPFDYPITKAYEIISCFEGLLDYFEASGEEKCLTACIRFADKVLATDFTIVGGTGCRDEYFDNSTVKQVLYSDINKQETCVTVTLMKFLCSLFSHTGKATYIDAVETAFFNLYLGALRDGECFGHLAQPMFYSYSPLLNNPRWTLMGGGKSLSSYAVFGCCVAIGAAGAGVIPTVGVTGTEEEAALNLFYSGEYLLTGATGKVRLKIETRYPYDGEVQVHLLCGSAAGIFLKVRKPLWCKAFQARVNGNAATYAERENYICFPFPLKVGDFLNLNFEMPIRIVKSESVNPAVNTFHAFVKGPIVLCADSKDIDLAKNYSFEIDDKGNVIYRRIGDGVYCLKQKDGSELEMKEYKSVGKVYYAPRDISVWLKSK